MKRKGITYVETMLSLTIAAMLVVSVFAVVMSVKKDVAKTEGYNKLSYYITDITEKMTTDVGCNKDLKDLENKTSTLYSEYLDKFNTEDFKFEIINIEKGIVSLDKNDNTKYLYNVKIKVYDNASGAFLVSNFLIKGGAFFGD